MKQPLTTLVILLLFALNFVSQPACAQAPRQDTLRTGTARASDTLRIHAANAAAGDDDEFNVILLAVLTAFICIVIGATLAGSMAATLVMIGLFGLVSAGVLSAGILVALYRRSITAGFKTILAMVCSFGGILIGVVSFYLINRIFQLHLSGVAVLLIGGFSGLVGGMLLGMAVFLVIRVFLNYCRQKLKLILN
ncbi:MAG TPA: hypothetical protein VKQ52_06435 [Puia sp.]|nr:hypothetical protein [Puia sp.]